MRHDTPLRHRHEEWCATLRSSRRPVAGGDRPGAAKPADLVAGARPGVEWLPYGPLDESGAPLCAIVADYGEAELEYAAIRRSAGLLDGPHRGSLRIRGKERREFLNRMLTQELKEFGPGQSRSSFWLNRKGRIEADLFLMETGDEILADVDVHQATSTVATLGEYLFSEDVQIVDASEELHRLSLHGPAALAVAGAAAGQRDWTLASQGAATLTIGGTACHVARRDLLGDPGLELFVSRERAESVWDALLSVRDGERPRARPIGWQAFNVARVEAGAAMFNIDFDVTCLPHETGLLRQRVSFTKGCYLGQEIVARMESLGRPKRHLVGLRIRPLYWREGDTRPGEAAVLPEAGSNVHAVEPTDGAAIFGEPVGQVTSSACSPMLGAAPIAMAMLRSSHVGPGTRVGVAGEGAQALGVVGPLRAWPPETTTGAVDGQRGSQP